MILLQDAQLLLVHTDALSEVVEAVAHLVQAHR